MAKDFGGHVGDMASGLRGSARVARDWAGSLERGAQAMAKLSNDSAGLKRSIADVTENLQMAQAEFERLARAGEKTYQVEKDMKGFNKQIKNLNKNLRDTRIDVLVSGFDKLGKGLLKVHTAIFSLGFSFLTRSITAVYELSERWAKVTGALNMKLGGLSAGMGRAQKAAARTEGKIRALTDTFGEGHQMAGELIMSFGFMGKKFEEVEDLSVQLARGFGLGAEGAGNLLRSLDEMGMTSGQSAVAMSKLIDAANDVDVPINMLAHDVAESSDVLARFGKEGITTFVRGAAYARKFGISVKQLTSSMQKFDTFDSAAQSAAKLNIVFGTTINSMDLLLSDDYAGRFETMRQQLLAQGMTWDKMSAKKRRLISEEMGMTEKQMSAALSAENASFSLQDVLGKQQEKEESEAAAKAKMQKNLAMTAQTLFSFGAAMDRITRAIGKAIDPLLKVFGLGSALGEFNGKMRTTTDVIVEFFEGKDGHGGLAGNPKWAGAMTELGNDLKSFFKTVGEWIVSGKAANAVGNISEVMMDLYRFGRDAFKAMFEWGKKLMPVIEFIFKHSKEILVAWGAMKGGAAIWKMLPSGGRSMIKGGIGSAFSGAKSGIGDLVSTGADMLMPNRASAITRRAQRTVAGTSALPGRAAMGLAGGMGGAALAGGGVGSQIAGGLAGSLVGMIPVVGPLLGPIVGAGVAFIAKELGRMFDRKSESEKRLEVVLEGRRKAEESYERTQADAAVQDAKFDAVRERRRQQDVIFDAALSKAKKGDIKLSQEEQRSIEERLDEMSKFGATSEAANGLLSSLSSTADLTRGQLSLLAQISETYSTTIGSLQEKSRVLADQLQNEIDMREGFAVKQAEASQKIIEAQVAQQAPAYEAAKAEFDTASKKIIAKIFDPDFLFGKSPGEKQAFIEDELTVVAKNFEKEKRKRDELIEQQKMGEMNLFKLKEQNEKKMMALGQLRFLQEDKGFLKFADEMLAKDATRSMRGLTLDYLEANKDVPAGVDSQFVLEQLALGNAKAAGGIVTRPQIAMIGEAGPEAVIPLRAMAQGRLPAKHGGRGAQQLVNYASGGAQGGAPAIQLVAGDVYLDGQKVGRHIVRQALSSREI